MTNEFFTKIHSRKSSKLKIKKKKTNKREKKKFLKETIKSYLIIAI